MKRALLSVFLLMLVFQAALFAQPADPDADLWSYIGRQSQVWYMNMLKQTGVLPPGVWQKPIETAFLRIANNSGEKDFHIQYAVLKGNDFNAACFPGGQFIIMNGTLSVFDQIITFQTGKALNQIPANDLATYRENLLAAVIGHELGHYYNRHSFNMMKKSWSLFEKSPENLDLALIKFSQENEFEADRTGYLLLQKAGYNPDLMVAILELLNTIQQDGIKGVPATSFITYLQTHPSPHERLARFTGKNQEWHKWAAQMETAFTDIALGKNLKASVVLIDNALTAAPDNLYLLKARAVALHKQWLASVSMKDQVLRGVIDLPAFRDEMVYSKIDTRGVKKTPGDLIVYGKAKEAYYKVYARSVDAGFYSNFSLLLAYSTDAKDQTTALNLGKQAVGIMATFSNCSNLGVVMFLLDMKDQALDLFSQVAGEYNQKFGQFIDQAAIDPQAAQVLMSMRQQLKLTQALSPEFVYGDYTPVLNFAIVLALTGDTANAKIVATEYLNYYEFTSSWAAYAATLTGAAMPRMAEVKPMSVAGLKIGSNINQVTTAWGKADGIETAANGEEAWYYKAKNIYLYINNGQVVSIEMLAAESPKADGKLGVGMTRADIEKMFGKHKRVANQYFIYEGAQNFGVLYSNAAAVAVVLF